ncbi:hypothetical protein ADH75_11180 [Flavonifractor plautii]|nr:hypothetical protein A4U99_18260 [Flavonifractor plautii]OXE46722.1 hypothetical protein ADH75_11180 [Flavonifractor plautii]
MHLGGLFQIPHAARRAGTPDLFICPGQVNCPGIKVLAVGQNAWTAHSAARLRRGWAWKSP